MRRGAFRQGGFNGKLAQHTYPEHEADDKHLGWNFMFTFYAFYDACDEFGIMLYHDMQYAQEVRHAVRAGPLAKGRHAAGS